MEKVKFREVITSARTTILAGRNAENNEELVKQVGKNEEVFHTAAPGSPFVNIKGEPKIGDLKIAAIFCAMHSKDWKKNKQDVLVHRFLGKDIFKTRGMKTGTFGIKRFKLVRVKRKDIENATNS